MQVLDASAIIHAWDSYPQNQFPGLWRWLKQQIREHSLTIPLVAMKEVDHKAPDCSKWLQNAKAQVLHPDVDVVRVALSIKKAIGISDDKYHPKGVDENDIFIIATVKVAIARENEVGLITNEARQFNTPRDPKKKKIPAVCNLNTVGVRTLNFLEYIKKSQQIF